MCPGGAASHDRRGEEGGKMAAAIPTPNTDAFERALRDPAHFPFYCVLLYPPLNGMNERLRQYTTSRWWQLDRLTGDACALLVVDDIDRRIRQYQPEDIYDIARDLGAKVVDLPCMIFFTDPEARTETMILRLTRFLPAAKEVTDEHFTNLFSVVAAACDTCRAERPDRALGCLRRQLMAAWPRDSRRSVETAQDFDQSLARTGTILDVLGKALGLLKP
jgi:hypothetical protein